MRSPNWTHDELIVAFNLYCKLPFGRIHNRNPEIVALANAIGRTPSAVSFKLANFSSLDPDLKERGIEGASHGSKSDAAVWHEFAADWGRLAFESEAALARITNRPMLENIQSIEDDPDIHGEGKEREAIIRIRVNQQFFRSVVMAAYDLQCCISGMAVPDLLNASHIVPWAEDVQNRVNPRNGLCLNVLLDRAFDRGLITVTPDCVVKVSPKIHEFSHQHALHESIIRYHAKPISMPRRFHPNPELLRYHCEQIFQP